MGPTCQTGWENIVFILVFLVCMLPFSSYYTAQVHQVIHLPVEKKKQAAGQSKKKPVKQDTFLLLFSFEWNGLTSVCTQLKKRGRPPVGIVASRRTCPLTFSSSSFMVQ